MRATGVPAQINDFAHRKRRQLSDLRADVVVNTDHIQTGQTHCALIHRERIGVCHAELIRLQTGGNIRMRFRSTSGFTRKDTGARLPIRRAISLMRSNPGADSALKQKCPAPAQT